MVEEQKKESRRGGWRPLVGGGVALLLLGGLSFVLPLREWLVEVVVVLQGMGRGGQALFLFLYLLGSLLMVPLFPLNVIGGVVFGVGWGFVLLLPLAVLGSVLAVWLGARWFQAPLLRAVARRPAWRAICQALEQQGFRAVILARLSPVMPFSLQNYVLGASGVRPWQMALGTALGLLPAQFAALYVGTLVTDLAQLHHQLQQGPPPLLRWALMGLGLLALSLLVLWLGRVAQRALQNNQQD